MLKSILNFDGVQELNKNAQKTIVGGAMFSCQCSGSVGAWEGNYSSVTSAVNSIGRWCESGEGSCVAMAEE